MVINGIGKRLLVRYLTHFFCLFLMVNCCLLKKGETVYKVMSNLVFFQSFAFITFFCLYSFYLSVTCRTELSSEASMSWLVLVSGKSSDRSTLEASMTKLLLKNLCMMLVKDDFRIFQNFTFIELLINK